jgi:acylphosphatase
MKAYKFVVSGKVQGVGFRYFTKKTADKLKILGWVMNQIDGRVQGFIQGDELQIDKMKLSLKNDLPFGRVDKLVLTEFPIDSTLIDFKIKH